MYNMLQGCHLVQNIAIEDGAGSLHFFGGDKGFFSSWSIWGKGANLIISCNIR